MDKGKSASAQLIFNLIMWLVILLLPFLFFPFNRSFSPFHSERFVMWYVYSMAFLLTYYYINGYILIEKFLANKKTLLYIVITLACFFLYMYLFNLISVFATETQRYVKEHARDPKFMRYPKAARFFASGPITLFLLAWIGSSASSIVSRWFNAEKIKEQITKQQLEMELSFLKSQVNPHFLFNTLNSIYTLAITNNNRTADSVLKLSRIMRYTLEESKTDFVQLNAEIEFIQSYIDLQKMRLNDNVKVAYSVEGNPELVKVPPLLFIPFVENAFKYGISAHHPSEVLINFHIGTDKLLFRSLNDLFPNNPKMEGTGTGITNVKRRLNLLYGDKYALEIGEANNKFLVTLEIPIG